MRQRDILQENAVFLQDEALAAGKIEIGLRQGIGGEALAIGLVGGEIFDVVDAIGRCQRAFMRSEIADQVRAIAWDDLAPGFAILCEGVVLERVDLVADETGNHGFSPLLMPLFSHIAARRWFGYDRSMKEGPDIAQIGSLIGDPARANILTALMGGRALTATELAAAAGVTLQTASAHLAKLEAGGLLTQRKQGRHRYFTLADDRVGKLLEGIMGFAASRGHLRHRPGPREPALRKARICYDHLAGDYGVRMLDSLIEAGSISAVGEGLNLTADGERHLGTIGIDVSGLRSSRRPLCRSCLDWSERRAHLAGSLGKALLSNFLDKGWARRTENSRSIFFTPEGERRFLALFPLELSDGARQPEASSELDNTP